MSGRPFPKHPRRLLIRSTNWIGDAIMTTPAVRTIRENFPQSQITLLCLDWVRDVFAASPRIDHILVYDKTGQHQGLAGRLRLIRELRQHRFDATILLQNAFEAALVTRLAAIPARGGYTTDGRALLLTHPVRKAAHTDGRHQVHYYLEMVQGLGLRPAPPELELFLREKDCRYAATLLATLPANQPIIGLNPGAAYGPAKRWPSDRFAELARNLPGHTLLVFGTPADQQAARTICQAAGTTSRVVDLTGRTTLGQTMALIQRCHVFVTNDSGLMHVAAALKTPLVAIFGSTDHIATGPWSTAARIVRHPVDCSPCLRPTCKQGHFACMRRVTVEEVNRAISSLLESTQKRLQKENI